uniref:TRPM SLOG domain-containing protein n=1 Tax=Ciona intestinalis TaxID=7719 RepID=H2Y3F5_CIOIN
MSYSHHMHQRGHHDLTNFRSRKTYPMLAASVWMEHQPRHNKNIDSMAMDKVSSAHWIQKTFKIPKPEDGTVLQRRTDAFSDLNFVGAKNKQAKYIRVGNNTPPQDIYELLTTRWNLQTPNLIISVTGGASNFHMNSSLTKEFRRSLIKLAESTGAWIVTGGTNTGVMKHVGKAVHEYAAVK